MNLSKTGYDQEDNWRLTSLNMAYTVRAIDISVYVMTSLKWRLGAFPWNLGLSHSSTPHVFLPLASPMGPSSPTKRQTELHYL